MTMFYIPQEHSAFIIYKNHYAKKKVTNSLASYIKFYIKFKRHKCKGIFMCKKCQMTFRTQQRLKTHKCKYCQICDHIFTIFQGYKTHLCKMSFSAKSLTSSSSIELFGGIMNTPLNINQSFSSETVKPPT